MPDIRSLNVRRGPPPSLDRDEGHAAFLAAETRVVSRASRGHGIATMASALASAAPERRRSSAAWRWSIRPPRGSWGGCTAHQDLEAALSVVDVVGNVFAACWPASGGWKARPPPLPRSRRASAIGRIRSSATSSAAGPQQVVEGQAVGRVRGTPWGRRCGDVGITMAVGMRWAFEGVARPPGSTSLPTREPIGTRIGTRAPAPLSSVVERARWYHFVGGSAHAVYSLDILWRSADRIGNFRRMAKSERWRTSHDALGGTSGLSAVPPRRRRLHDGGKMATSVVAQDRRGIATAADTAGASMSREGTDVWENAVGTTWCRDT